MLSRISFHTTLLGFSFPLGSLGVPGQDPNFPPQPSSSLSLSLSSPLAALP